MREILTRKINIANTESWIECRYGAMMQTNMSRQYIYTKYRYHRRRCRDQSFARCNKTCKLKPRRWRRFFTAFSGNATNRVPNATADRNCATRGATHRDITHPSTRKNSNFHFVGRNMNGTKLVCYLFSLSLSLFFRVDERTKLALMAKNNRGQHGRWMKSAPADRRTSKMFHG